MIAIHGFDDVLDSDDEVPVLPPCGSVQMLPPMLPPSATFGADDSDSDDSLLAAASKSTGLLPSGVGGMKKLINNRDDGDDGDENDCGKSYAEASTKRRKVNSKQKAVTPRTKGKPQHDDTPEKFGMGEIEKMKRRTMLF